MKAVSFNKIKELKHRLKETVLIDLGKFINGLDGIVIPIKVKTVEEVLDLQDKYKPQVGKMTIAYKPFRQMPKAFREFYKQSENYVAGTTETTYFQLLKLDEDENKIKAMEFRERLFNIILHIDMDYEVRKGVSYWEDAEIKAGDYNAVLDVFSGVLVFDNHLETLEVIIDSIKSGNTTEEQILAKVYFAGLNKYLATLPEDERKKAIEDIEKARQEAFDKMLLDVKDKVETSDKTGDVNESKN